MEMSIAEASSMFPGFRFLPTDEELIQHYLKKKLQGSNEAVDVIAEVDISNHEPWDLPALSKIHSDDEWFYFSPRRRRYPNGSQRRKRATECGYWKATGKERVVKSGSNIIGTKRTLVFHTGRAPRGQRTEWMMQEYTTSSENSTQESAMVACRLQKNVEFHLRSGETPKNNNRDNNDGPNSNTSKESSDQNSHSMDQVRPEGTDVDFYSDVMNDDILKLDSEIPSTKWPISIMEHASETMLKFSDPKRAKVTIKAPQKSRRWFIWARGIKILFVLVFVLLLVMLFLYNKI